MKIDWICFGLCGSLVGCFSSITSSNHSSTSYSSNSSHSSMIDCLIPLCIHYSMSFFGCRKGLFFVFILCCCHCLYVWSLVIWFFWGPFCHWTTFLWCCLCCCQLILVERGFLICLWSFGRIEWCQCILQSPCHHQF